MYDMTKLIPRYFNLRLKNNKVIDVEPPKLKVLKKIMKLAKNNTEDVSMEDYSNIILATSMALSKNKQNYNVSIEWLEDNHNLDELMDLLQHYFEWVDEIYASKN